MSEECMALWPCPSAIFGTLRTWDYSQRQYRSCYWWYVWYCSSWVFWRAVSSGTYAAVPGMFYTPCPYIVWRSCRYRMMYSPLILVVHDTLWHRWRTVAMLGNQVYFLFSCFTLWDDCCLVGKVSWDTLPIHVRRQLLGPCWSGLQQSTISMKLNYLPYEGSFYPFLWQWVSLYFFSKSWSFTGCTLKSLSFSALDKARSPLSLAWRTSSDVANWPVAMLMSLLLSWNGLIIFSSRTVFRIDTPCHVSHFESFFRYCCDN